MLKLLHLIFAWIMWVCRLYHSSSRFCSSFTTFMDLTASHVLNGRFLPQNSVELHVFTNFNRKDSCTIFFFFVEQVEGENKHKTHAERKRESWIVYGDSNLSNKVDLRLDRYINYLLWYVFYYSVFRWIFIFVRLYLNVN